MSKHTTNPRCTWQLRSHTMPGNVPGNWNKHKHRRIPSRIRTVGRLARALRRLKADQNLGVTMAQFADLHGKGWLERLETAEQMAGLRDDYGRLTQLAMNRMPPMAVQS